ncbi:superoxide dismutase [Virgibacillus indicus]|uniref:superoxide dismutase n=1 Tax=Virgibacillus indicus TaxID=2024554 RepID=A0A265NE49_9BACI|nr:superoxide dismutase [Virgibacillus indicus]OZU90065.1 superoxide dismutase [Virgibacillus indicus]
MDEAKQEYLESLNAWGEQIKDKLKSTDIPKDELNEWAANLDNWQEEIQSKLAQERNPEHKEIHELQEVGNRILSDIKNKQNKNPESSIPFGKHTLPPLPYKYNALEPYISEEIMRLHHDKHHQSYVDGLNKAEKALYDSKTDTNLIKHWLREQAFNGSGHYLHTIFWYNMTPNSAKEPKGEIKRRIKRDFGSWKRFKNLFTEAANSVEGVGWAVLVWAPRSGRLAIQTIEKHQLFQQADVIPLLVLDVWEHAYYLQYKTDKKDYISNWWNVVNWDNVNERYKEAIKVRWSLY